MIFENEYKIFTSSPAGIVIIACLFSNIAGTAIFDRLKTI